MRTQLRKNIYSAIPLVIAVAVGYGVVSAAQGAAVAGFAAQAVTAGFATYYAFKQGAPITRTVIYGLVSAAGVVAAAFGWMDPSRVELIVPAVMGVVGILVAQSTTDGGAEGIDSAQFAEAYDRHAAAAEQWLDHAGYTAVAHPDPRDPNGFEVETGHDGVPDNNPRRGV